MDQTKPQKAPVGVQVLAILEYIVGAFFLILGVLAFSRSDTIFHVLHYNGYSNVVIATSHPLLGLFLILLGIIHFILGSGLWEGRHWAYLWVVVFSILYVIVGIIAFAQFGYTNYISLILNVIVLAYLLASPHAKAYLA